MSSFDCDSIKNGQPLQGLLLIHHQTMPFGMKMPSIEVEVKLPAVEVEVKAPKMPSVEVKLPAVEIEVKAPKMAAIEVEVEVKLPAVEIEVKAPKMAAIEVEVKLPAVEVEVEAPKMPAVEIEVKAPAEDEFRNKLLASIHPAPAPETPDECQEQEPCDDMQPDELEVTKCEDPSDPDELPVDREERLIAQAQQSPFVRGWPGTQKFVRLGNGDQMELPSVSLDYPPLFFMGTVLNQLHKHAEPVPYAQVTVWVSNECEDTGSLGGTFACDSKGEFWFQSVAPSAYTVLKQTEDGNLESCSSPAHFSFCCTHPLFENEVMHLFVKEATGEGSEESMSKRSSRVRLQQVDDPAEAARRGCQNPFIDVHCDIQLSLEPVQSESEMLADEIMEMADGFSHNRFLSVSEIGTFLQGTKYDGFSRWLLYNREKNFKKFDKNRDGGISTKELTRAISMYRATHQTGNCKYYY